jgi:3-deoxy-manno-octulosonate cytidylyltransferase (CMP-KDO synthetase)
VNSEYHIVIPVRLASQRLPGKPLLEIAGKPMIEWVWRRAQAAAAASVVIATDTPAIAEAAAGFGATAVLTADSHTSGSDRIAECADRQGWDDATLIVNLQGDEPLMPPACLDQVAALLATDCSADVASLHWPIEDASEVTDPNVVKVVVAADGSALYFSRSAIPHARDFADAAAAMREGVVWHRHVGLYAYRAGALRAFAAMTATPLEQTEKLEQLRFLESGRRLVMARAIEPIPAGVDTPEDLRRVRGALGGTA